MPSRSASTVRPSAQRSGHQLQQQTAWLAGATGAPLHPAAQPSASLASVDACKQLLQLLGRAFSAEQDAMASTVKICCMAKHGKHANGLLNNEVMSKQLQRPKLGFVTHRLWAIIMMCRQAQLWAICLAGPWPDGPALFAAVKLQRRHGSVVFAHMSMPSCTWM